MGLYQVGGGEHGQPVDGGVAGVVQDGEVVLSSQLVLGHRKQLVVLLVRTEEDGGVRPVGHHLHSAGQLQSVPGRPVPHQTLLGG